MAYQILVFNDLHLADKPPAMRRPGYMEEGLAMLQEVVELAKDVPYLISTGDLFHVKTPSRTSHQLVGNVIDILQQRERDWWGSRLHIVPGNHDMTEKGLASLPEQPLMQLERAKVARLFTSWVRPEPDLLFLPRPYDVHRDADPSYYRRNDDEPRLDAGKTLMFAHGSIVPPGVVRPYPVAHWEDITAKNPGWDLLAAGHIHEDLNGWRRDGHAFVNLGSLGRVAKTEANLTRTVQVALITVDDDINVDPIPLKSALPAEDIFLDIMEGPEIDDDAIQEFVKSLSGGLGMEQIDLIELVQGVPEAIRPRLLHYLEAADGK